MCPAFSVLSRKECRQHSHSERAHPAAQLPDRASPRQTVLTTEGQPAESSPDRDHSPAPTDKHGSDRAKLGWARLG